MEISPLLVPASGSESCPPDIKPRGVREPHVRSESVKPSDEANFKLVIGGPNGVRTRVTGVRGRCPRPLDDGTMKKAARGERLKVRGL